MRVSAFQSFARDRSGIAAVEFAFIAPVLLVAISGAAELSSAITSANRATFIADAVGEMVSRTPPQTKLTDADLRNFSMSGVLVNPDVARYARQAGLALDRSFNVTITSVDFKKKNAACILACEYEANVIFSYALNGAQRACGQKLLPSVVATNDLTKLQQELYRPGTLIVVDVAVVHRPLVFGYVKYFGGDITFNRSSYFRPREQDRVDSATRNCSAYPVS